MERYANKIKTSSIRFRALAMLICVNVAIILLFALTSYIVFEKILIEQIGSTRSDVLRQISERIKVVKNNADTLSNLYYFDGRFQNYLGESEEKISPEMKEYLDATTQQYKASFLQVGMEYTMVLALESGGGYSTELVPENYDYMNPKIRIWYKPVYQEKGNIVNIASYKDKYLDNKGYFSVARSILGKSGEPIAYLMINVHERQIHDMYESVVSENSNIYIVDGKGTIISSNIEKIRGFNYFGMKNLDGLFGEKDYVVTNLPGHKVLFTKCYDETTGFTVLEEIPLNDLLWSLDRVRLILIIVASAAVLLACVWAWNFSNHIINPIQQLSNFILSINADNIEGNCDVTGYSEINNLSQGLNSMLARIRDLVKSEKQKEKQKRDMELSFLQAQINPHFMYNSLFSIKCMIDMDKNEEASKMLTAFITLLRNTLSNPNEFITLKTEFEILRQFSQIQQFRYTTNLEIILECEEDAEQQKIPKLLIQPLVENAIFHGVAGKGGHGIVIVSARLVGRDVHITIEDDGVGMSAELIEQLSSGNVERKSSHIGIVNVKERIQLYFGDKYGIKIESQENMGTKLVVTMPAIE